MACRCIGCGDGSPQLAKSGRALLANGIDPPLSSDVVDTPPELAMEYQAMLRRASLSRPLTLRCRNRVAQVGQWTSDGVVVLGLEDIRERARLLERRLHVRKTQGHWSPPVPDLDSLDAFAQRQVLAHEIGHELDQHERRSSPYVHPEAVADYWAGWLEGQRSGSDEDLGAEFFAVLGCNVQGCSHPRSSDRADAYRQGFTAGRLVAAKPQSRQIPREAIPPRQPPPRPSSSGPSVGKVLGIFALGAAALVGIAAALGGTDDSYDEKAGRYRDKKGRFRKG